jgi:hypothetical protein
MGKNQQAKDLRREMGRIIDLMAKYQVPLPVELIKSPHFEQLRMPFAEKVALFLAPMDRERNEASLREGTRMLHESLNQLLDQAPEKISFEDRPEPVHLACQVGCNHCCTLRVALKAPEVILLANALRKRLSPEEMAALKDRIEKFELDLSTKSLIERAYRSVLCPLNVDSLCIAYLHRPINCSSYHSFSLQSCLDDMADPAAGNVVPTDPYRRMLQAMHGQALECGLMALGLDHDDLELVPALRIALADPDAGAKYLRGEPAFAEANQPELREALDREFESHPMTQIPVQG